MFGIPDLVRAVGELSNVVKALRVGALNAGKDLRSVASAVDRLTAVLALRRPGRVFLVVLEGSKLAKPFKLFLPVSGASDVATRVLTVQIADKEPVRFELPGSAGWQDGFEAEVGDIVRGSLVDVDGAGNRSEPSEFAFEITDVIAPPKPGDVQLIQTGTE